MCFVVFPFAADSDLESKTIKLVGKPGKKNLCLVCASSDERAFWFEGLQGLVRQRVVVVRFISLLL